VFNVPTFTARRLHVTQRKVQHVGLETSGNLDESSEFQAILGIFYMSQIYDMYRRLYFPSEGSRAEDFFALKNPMASAGFEPAN
jgi:hypothetical protein